MPPASEHELAFSMMKMWGKDARCSARRYASEGLRQDNTAEFRKWHAVGQIIEQMQAAQISRTDSAYDFRQPVVTDRRVGSLEAIAGMVMLALQRLGGTAIRGAIR